MSERDNAGDDTDLAGERRPRAAAQLSGKAGILPRQDIRNLVHRKVLQAKADFDPGQFQPASLDLRLGARPSASAPPSCPAPPAPSRSGSPTSTCTASTSGPAPCWRRAASTSCRSSSAWRCPRRISAVANAKSSTGRLDLFTRLITDRAASLRPHRPAATPARSTPRSRRAPSRSWSGRGLRLNQIRFRAAIAASTTPRRAASTAGPSACMRRRAARRRRPACARPRSSLDLARHGDGLVGYRAKPHTGLIDLDRIGAYDPADFWEPVTARDRRLILDPGDFYILQPRGGARAPRLRRRDGAIYPTGRRVPRPLRRLLRPRLRPRPAGRPAPAACSRSAATRPPSRSTTARWSAASSTSAWPSAPESSTAATPAPTTRARA